jgi:hypothetical protein
MYPLLSPLLWMPKSRANANCMQSAIRKPNVDTNAMIVAAAITCISNNSRQTRIFIIRGMKNNNRSTTLVFVLIKQQEHS